MMRMRKIIFATGNAGKMKEIRMILDGLAIDGMPAEILSMIFPLSRTEKVLRKMPL